MGDPFVTDGEKLSDIAKLQPEALRSTDETEALDILLAVRAVPVGTTVGQGQQTDPLVIADRVRPDPDFRRHLGDSCNHVRSVNHEPWSNVKPSRSRPGFKLTRYPQAARSG